MRPLLVAALATIGCGPSPIAVTFSQQMGTSPSPGTSYNAPIGTAKVANGTITLESKSAGGDLFIMVDVPPYPVTISVGDHCLLVDWTLTASGKAWGSTLPTSGAAGTMRFDTATSPYKVTFSHILMAPATPGVTGDFVLDGSAEFSD